mgnify:CR=1 FL=1
MRIKAAEEKDLERDLLDSYINPVVSELFFMDLLFDEWISHLSEDEVLEIRRQLMGSDVGEA